LTVSAGSGTAQIEVPINDSAPIVVGSGNLSLTNGPTIISGSGFLSSRPGTTISLSGNLLGPTQNAEQFAAEGTVLFDGSGSSSSPQLLEAMSADQGAVGAGFANNFDYNTLSIGPGDYVRLVDQSRNTNSGAPEAL
jgi:hypothetical protein